MQELETEIAAWRARLMAAMPTQNETVRELEVHLRDHIEVQMRRGVSANEAFTAAVKRIGEPRVVAREFERLEPRWFGMWRPTAMSYGLVAAAFLWYPAVLVYEFFVPSGVVVVGDGLLLRACAVTLMAGYLAVIGAGMLGGCVLATGWRRTLSQREGQARHRELFRLVLMASVLLPLGIGLRILWAKTNAPFEWWSWKPDEIGALAVLISTWLQLAQFRLIADNRLRVALALIGAALVGTAEFGANAATGLVPDARMCGLTILSQVAILFLHLRVRRDSTEAVCE